MRGFDDVAKDTLDEWIYYLKNSKIRDDFTAQGLKKAYEVLALESLSDEEKAAYWRHVEDQRNRESEITSAFTDGEIKGKAIGLEKGKAIGLEEGRAEGESERTMLKAELQAAQAEKEAAQAEKEAAQAEKDAARELYEARIAELQRQLSEKK